TGLCGLVPYLDFDSDSPDEMSSPEHISLLPTISPFLCTDSSEAPNSSDGPPSQVPYVMVVARWRSKVASRPSSSFEFPIAPVTAPPRTRRRPTILIRPREAIPFGRPYRTHLNGPHHHSSSSSLFSDSLPVHSLGLDAPDQAHSGSSTRDVSPELESSSGDSSERPLHSSSHSDGPSRKRCRSRVDFVPSSTEDTEIDPIKTDVDIELGIGDADDVRDHVEIDPRDVRDDAEGYEADTSIGDTVKVGIDPMSALIVEEEIVEPAGEDSSNSSGTRDDIVRSFEDMPIDLDDVVRDFYHHMSDVCIDKIVGIETVQRRLEVRVSMIERIDSLRLENLKVRAML
ncbi:hypothetical protein Tco_1333858, partial [Tanacetum coccineum]